MTNKLTNTVALVTGASSGIGRATALALAAEGATIAAVARRADRLSELVEEITTNGGTALAVPADITDQVAAGTAVKAVADNFGRIDILVNNAGVMRVGPVVGADVDEWNDMIDINLKGLLYVTNAALPYLQKAAKNEARGVADIVNISSLAGRTASTNFGVYNMTKFGVNGFTESLRQELAQQRIRVGVLEPGAVKTELNDASAAGEARADIRKEIADLFATIRTLDAADIADGVAYMVTRPSHTAIGELWIMPTDQG